MTALIALTRNELRLFRRDPAGIFWTVLFPFVLLIVFGVIPGFREVDPAFGGVRGIDVYTPVVIVLSMTMLAVAGLPAAVATYRERLVLKRLATTPVGPGRVLGALLLQNLLLSAAVALGVLAVARVAFGVALAGQLVGYLLALLLIAAALMSIGLLIAALSANAKVAQAVGTVTFFPLMFFGGLWIPLPLMPAALRTLSDVTPLGAGVQALSEAAAGHWPGYGHVGVLVAYVVVFGAAAARFFRWE